MSTFDKRILIQNKLLNELSLIKENDFFSLFYLSNASSIMIIFVYVDTKEKLFFALMKKKYH